MLKFIAFLSILCCVGLIKPQSYPLSTDRPIQPLRQAYSNTDDVITEPWWCQSGSFLIWKLTGCGPAAWLERIRPKACPSKKNSRVTEKLRYFWWIQGDLQLAISVNFCRRPSFFHRRIRSHRGIKNKAIRIRSNCSNFSQSNLGTSKQIHRGAWLDYLVV